MFKLEVIGGEWVHDLGKIRKEKKEIEGKLYFNL